MSDARLLIDTLQLLPAGDASSMTARWKAADTSAIVRLAEYEGAALWLNRRLKTLDIALVGMANDRLTPAATRAIAKSLRIDAETDEVLEILDEGQVPVIPLKSAVLRRIVSRVPHADARAPSDVDLLVHADMAQRAWDVLIANGYARAHAPSPSDAQHHLPVLIGPLGVGVELHLTTAPEVAPEEAWRRATIDGATAVYNGAARTVPGDTELLWHALSHSIGTAVLEARDGLRLRYWLDAAALIAAGVDLDWARIRERIESSEVHDPAFVRGWLLVASELAGRALPPSALGSGSVVPFNLERQLAWRLRMFARYAASGRWERLLLEEGARGEASLPVEPPQPGIPAFARTRHGLATRAARLWWLARR